MTLLLYKLPLYMMNLFEDEDEGDDIYLLFITLFIQSYRESSSII